MILNKNKQGFTIVELLVVIVVIGILASITIVSYTGVTQKAIAVSLQSDLKNAVNQMAFFNINNSNYPLTLDCLQPDSSTNLCIKASNGATLNYALNNNTVPMSYSIIANKDDSSYVITNNGIPSRVAKSFVTALSGTGSDLGRAIAYSTDGGYVVVGYVNGLGAGGYDAIVVKYSASGIIEWSKTWGGAADDYGYSIDNTSDGGYIVAGYSYSYGNGYSDLFMNKYDSSGNLLWNKSWGETGIEYIYSVVSTSDGGFAVAGVQYYNYDSGDGQMFIVKYGSNGSVQWKKRMGKRLLNADLDRAFSLDQTQDNGFILAGVTTGYGAGVEDVLLVKLNADGSLAWKKTWGGAALDIAYDVTEDLDGNYVIVGDTASFGQGSSDSFIAKYNSSGTLIWDKTWGGAAYDKGYYVTINAENEYIVVGQTVSFGAGSYDSFIAKYSDDGTLQWDRTWGGTGDDRGYAAVEAAHGGYAVTGFSSGFGAGGYDIFTAKYRANGNIDGCSSPMCQDPNVIEGYPNANETIPSVDFSFDDANGSVSVSTATESVPAATITNIIGF